MKPLCRLGAYKVAVEAQRSVDGELAGGRRQQRRQPPANTAKRASSKPCTAPGAAAQVSSDPAKLTAEDLGSLVG